LIPFVVLLLVGGCAPAPTPAPTSTPVPPTATPGAPGIPRTRIPFLASETWQKDVTYCQDGDVALKMDVMYPSEAKGQAAPVAVFLHVLDRNKDTVDIDAAGELLKRGYVVVAPNWRHTADLKLPVGIADAKCVIRHLRANAATYGIDPNRIGAWGWKAGGTLAALLGVTNSDAGLEGNSGFADQSSQIEAVAAADAITFVHFAWPEGQLQDMFGISSADDPVLAKASPVTYVSKDSPPFLLFQDEDAETRPGNQELYDALKANGVPATFVEVTGCDACGYFGTPTRAERAVIIADFFDKSLK
jgi:pectinesterase